MSTGAASKDSTSTHLLPLIRLGRRRWGGSRSSSSGGGARGKSADTVVGVKHGALATFDDDLFSEADIVIVPTTKATGSTESHCEVTSADMPDKISKKSKQTRDEGDEEISLSTRSQPTSTTILAASSIKKSVFLPPHPKQEVEEEEEGGWVESLRGEERAAVVRKNRDQLALSATLDIADDEDKDVDKDEDIDEENYGKEELGQVEAVAAGTMRAHRAVLRVQPAEAVEKTFILRSPSLRITSEALSSNTPVKNKRNVKVFRKNRVCRVEGGDQLRFSSMQLVLPKESEREIQVGIGTLSVTAIFCYFILLLS